MAEDTWGGVISSTGQILLRIMRICHLVLVERLLLRIRCNVRVVMLEVLLRVHVGSRRNGFGWLWRNHMGFGHVWLVLIALFDLHGGVDGLHRLFHGGWN